MSHETIETILDTEIKTSKTTEDDYLDSLGFSSQIIISDDDVRKFSEELSKKFLNEYHILDYLDEKISMSTYVRNFRELVQALNFICIKGSYPYRFRYRLRRINKG